MSKKLLMTLLLSMPFAACTDHTGSLVVSDGPLPPINQPDTRVIAPGETSQPSTTGGGTVSQGSGSGSGTTGSGGSANSSNSGSGGGVGNPGGGGSGAGGGSQGGGGSAGSPVPEPGTLLLFGTGLASLAGFSLRRRRRED